MYQVQLRIHTEGRIQGNWLDYFLPPGTGTFCHCLFLVVVEQHHMSLVGTTTHDNPRQPWVGYIRRAPRPDSMDGHRQHPHKNKYLFFSLFEFIIHLFMINHGDG